MFSTKWVTGGRVLFVPTPIGGDAIGSESRYLQHAAGNGLILKEVGNAALTTTFRFVDKGAADREPLN
ncbi:hypothetical protein [Micromonospora sp. WMMD710]|uniref:hypothetical protein n=1 Tax=Micromonospora sp. WMMD710 TaxID=3016085 RepID=UPI0024175B8A|nr:hypothetical protein [Micromonospora sp. WMMD710]MDG4757202.1 hypothetical protein [Micromonospora sp. WMMD710]